MGEVMAIARFRNIVDVGAAMRGYIPPEQVLASERKCLVDSGAVMVLLPEDEADRLHLIRGEKVTVTYADERTEKLATGRGLEVTIGDRSVVTDCVIGPPLCEPLIGQLVLEGMDLLVDCAGHRLMPRPESPDRPSLKLK